MKNPFEIEKTYITEYSPSRITAIVQETLEKKNRMVFFSLKTFTGASKENHFRFKENVWATNNGMIYPTIQGTALGDNPTKIHIHITPRYGWILSFTLCAFVFLCTAFFTDRMSVDGIESTPTLYERSAFAIFGAGIPMLMCYVTCLRSIKHAERWIIQKLNLKEITS